MTGTRHDENRREADRFFELFHRFQRPEIPPEPLFEQVGRNVVDLLKLSHLGTMDNSLVEFHKQWLKTFGDLHDDA